MKFSIETDPRVQSLMSEALKRVEDAKRAVEDVQRSGVRRLVAERARALLANESALLGERVNVRTRQGNRVMHNIPTGEGVPVIPNLDERILAIIDNGTEQGAPEFEMAVWHGAGRDRANVTSSNSDQGQSLGNTPAWCGTAHCLAGWAVHLAGVDGYGLANATDDEVAGSAIFLKSTGSVPYFYGSNEGALVEMRERVLDAVRKKYAPESE